MSVVHQHLARFAEGNVFLDMVVGLVGAARRVEKIVGAAKGSGEAEELHAFDLFALGVISFSRRLLAHAGELEEAPRPESAPTAETRARDLLL